MREISENTVAVRKHPEKGRCDEAARPYQQEHDAYHSYHVSNMFEISAPITDISHDCPCRWSRSSTASIARSWDTEYVPTRYPNTPNRRSDPPMYLAYSRIITSSIRLLQGMVSACVCV